MFFIFKLLYIQDVKTLRWVPQSGPIVVHFARFEKCRCLCDSVVSLCNVFFSVRTKTASTRVGNGLTVCCSWYIIRPVCNLRNKALSRLRQKISIGRRTDIVIAEWWNQVSTTVIHGTQITVTGMLLVFFTLGLIIVAMILLTKLPWLQAKEEPKVTESAPAAPASKTIEPAPAKTQAVVSADDELAQVAAIAAALLSQQQGPTRRLSRPQVRPAGRWKRSGRAYQVGLSTFE